MIKVLHVINGADLGGISSMILNYYKNIDRNKYHFDFIYSMNEPLGHNGIELEKLGSKFFYVPKKSEQLGTHIKCIKKIIIEGKYDAIHVHSCLTSYVALAVAKYCGVKIRVAHAHNAVKEITGFRANTNRAIGNILIRKYATTRLACSKDAAIYTFGNKAIGEANVKILPNAIETKRYAFSKDLRKCKRFELGISQESFVFGTVGRMSIEKNQIFLISVLGEVIKKNPITKMLLIGDGNCRPQIEKELQKAGLSEYAIFTGQRTDVSELLNAYDAFVMPSKYEGFPVAGLEAGANGLPIVLSDTITKELGFLPSVDYVSLNETPSIWADKILHYCGEKRRENSTDIIKANSYDIEANVKVLEDVYSGEKM